MPADHLDARTLLAVAEDCERRAMQLVDDACIHASRGHYGRATEGHARADENERIARRLREMAGEGGR